MHFGEHREAISRNEKAAAVDLGNGKTRCRLVRAPGESGRPAGMSLAFEIGRLDNLIDAGSGVYQKNKMHDLAKVKKWT